MTTLHAKLRVGPDGKLVIPVGLEEAGKEVLVTVAPSDPGKAATPEEYRRLIESLAGSIDDPTFVRPAQGDFESRESIS